MKISIFGLGYVGSVSMACFSDLGHNVIGVDVSSKKVDYTNEGKASFFEDKLDILLEKGVRKKLITATLDSHKAVMESDLSFISVGTPSNELGDADLSYVKRVCKSIGKSLRDKQYHLIVIRSTIFPGTTEELLAPIIERASGKRMGVDFDVVFNPEFMREGNAINDFYDPPFIVFGGGSPKSDEILGDLHEDIDSEVIFVDTNVAEMLKFACNSFHATKVIFGNEIGNLCKEYKVDSHKVMEIFTKDYRLNLSPYYLKPGFAYGGSCLPKDLSETVSKARKVDLFLPLLESLDESNKLQIKKVFEIVKETDLNKIGLLGISFKSNTDDLRNSPLVSLFDMFLNNNYTLSLFDVNLNSTSNTEMLDQNHDIASRLVKSCKDLFSNSEVIIVGHNNKSFTKHLMQASSNQVIVDLVRLNIDFKNLKAKYIGLCW